MEQPPGEAAPSVQLRHVATHCGFPPLCIALSDTRLTHRTLVHEGDALGALFGVTKLVVGLFLGTLSQWLWIEQILGDPACLLLAGESQAGCSWPRHSSLLIINHECDHLPSFHSI